MHFYLFSGQNADHAARTEVCLFYSQNKILWSSNICLRNSRGAQRYMGIFNCAIQVLIGCAGKPRSHGVCTNTYTMYLRHVFNFLSIKRRGLTLQVHLTQTITLSPMLGCHDDSRGNVLPYQSQSTEESID